MQSFTIQCDILLWADSTYAVTSAVDISNRYGDSIFTLVLFAGQGQC